MNIDKTIFYSVFMVCVTIGICFCLHLTYRVIDKNNLSLTDKFTDCLQITMLESRESKKAIDIKEAKEICLNVGKTNSAKK